MKIRHKVHSEVVFKDARRNGNVYCCHYDGIVSGTILVPAEEYIEESDKPIDRWQDVTGECFLQDEGACLDYRRDRPCLAMPDGYRLRKVQVHEFTDEHHGPKWAFIVERRET